MEPKIDASPVAERPPAKQKIVDFLGLGDAKPESQLRQELGKRTKETPWWLKESFRDLNGKEIKGPVDPISKLRADLKTSNARSLSAPLINETHYAEGKSGDRNGEVVDWSVFPIYSDMVDAATEILANVGFNPNFIQGEDWIIPEPESRAFPTIYEDLQVLVLRDKIGGRIQRVDLIAHK